MAIKPTELNELFFNTITVYFGPYIFPEYPFEVTESRIVIAGELFDETGYLPKNTPVSEVIHKMYLITKTEKVLGWLSFMDFGEIVYVSKNYLVIKLPPLIKNKLLLRQLQKVIELRADKMLSKVKNDISYFWRERINQVGPELIHRIANELNPTPYVYKLYSEKFGVPYELIKSLPGLTEAIKYSTDSLEGVLEKLNIKLEKLKQL